MSKRKVDINDLVASFTFDPLPKGFVIAKPKKRETYKEELLYEIEKQGSLVITRKRDGWKVFAVKYKGKWKLYTDGINEITDRIPHIAEELATLTVPDKTVLAGEATMAISERDNAAKLSGVLNINTAIEKALENQKQSGFVHFSIFDVVFWGGEYRLKYPYFLRLSGVVGQAIDDKHLKFVHRIEPLKVSFDTAKLLVKQNNWEGLVLHNQHVGSSFRLDGGNPERVDGCWKWKPVYEDDFIATAAIFRPSRLDQVKEVKIAQIDPKTGKMFDCGKFGAFTKKVKDFLKKAEYPMVIQLEFELRFPTGKLRHAVFVRFRDDKKPKECVASESYTEAEFID